jgi:O-antigen/teichoic acid export membrane protein
LLNLIVGGLGMMLLLVFSRWFVVNVLQIESHLQDEAVTAFHIAAAIIFSTMFGQVFSSIIQAIHRFDVYSYITILFNCLLAAGNIVLVLLNQKIETLLALNLFLVILNGFVFYVYSRRLLPEFKFVFGFPKEIFRLVLRYSSAVIVSQSLANFMLLFERSWITSKLGTEAVTYYVIALNLGIYIHAFISSISLTIFPLSSETDALGDKSKLLTIYTKATKIVLVLAAFSCLTLIHGRNFVLGLWVGSEFVQKSSDTLITHAVTFSILAVAVISIQMIEGIGHPNVSAFVVFCWLIVSVPLMIFLTGGYGNLGIGLARLIGVLVFIPAILYTEKKVFGGVLGKFWQKNLLIISLASAASSLVEFFLFQKLSTSWVNFAGGAAVGGLVFGFVLFMTGFVSATEKEWLKSLFTRNVAKIT